MSTTLWKSTTTRVGIDAVEIIGSGVLVLFGEPVPEALADVAIVHENASDLVRPLRAGDQFVFAGNTYVLDEVGARASDNLTELGHTVIYIDQPDQALLPGAVKASGPAPEVPRAGSEISFLEV
ncbi:PTS glucitol/sorbitol transporter subunit IIA [Brooklawnia sp.]|uniref:PTS glucitol/sorbitol transporter subunit IIA n=1 Tax=Brooklawnia sp. TaxID=2699740 RepID=UPI00311F39E7